MLFSYQLADIRYIVACGHEIYQVIDFQFIVASWNDGFVSTLDGHDVVRRFRLAQVFQRLVENLAGFSQFDAQHDKRTVVHFPTLSHPTHFKTVGDVLCRKVFWVYQRVDAHVLEEIRQVRCCKFVVADFGHRLFCTQRLGEHTTVHVEVFIGGHADEQCSILYAGILQCLYARR